MYINILGDVYAQFSVPRERTIRDTSEAVRSRLVGEGRLPLPLPLPPPLLPPPSHPHSSLACSLFARPVTDVKEIVNGKEPRTKHARAIIDNGGVLSNVLPPSLPPSLPATAATIPFPPPSLCLSFRAQRDFAVPRTSFIKPSTACKTNARGEPSRCGLALQIKHHDAADGAEMGRGEERRGRRSQIARLARSVSLARFHFDKWTSYRALLLFPR